jgi:hypothetical protein
MTLVINKWSFLDYGLLAKQVAADKGHDVVDKWGQLDQTKMEKELEAAYSVPNLFTPEHVNDPAWSPDALRLALLD